MIGVRNAYQGKGYARKLIDEVEKLVSEHPTSTGLSLNTEVETNVNFYLHFGFQLNGQAKIDDKLNTWGFLCKEIKKLENLFIIYLVTNNKMMLIENNECV